MQTRDRLHRLIDALPEAELTVVEQLLAERRTDDDPFLRMLADAPEDDELVTGEEDAAIQEGIDALDRDDVVSHAELRRALGL